MIIKKTTGNINMTVLEYGNCMASGLRVLRDVVVIIYCIRFLLK